MSPKNFTPVTNIKPSKKYLLHEIVEENLIPGVGSYTTIYNLVTTKRVQVKGQKMYNKRNLEQSTTAKSIKAFHSGKAWSKIRGKIMVEGKELIIFRKLNNLI